MKVNIVSRNPSLCRLLSLELSRFGLIPTVSEVPLEKFGLCLIDALTCRDLPPSEHTVLFLFGEPSDNKSERRARVRLPLPFPLAELRRAITEYLTDKNSMPQTSSPPSPTAEEPREDQLVIHHPSQSATVGNGTPVPLSEIEYKLLCRLQEFGSKPLSHEHVKDILGEATSNKLNVYICFLRRKLETGNLRLIHTVRGQGYTLIPQERKKL